MLSRNSLNVLFNGFGENVFLSWLLTINLVFIGVLASYLNIPEFYWLGNVLFLALAFWLALTSLKQGIRHTFSSFIILLWLLYLIFSFLFLTESFELQKVGFKDYLMPTLFLYFISYVRFNDFSLELFYKQIRFISVLQVPFVMHQFFFLAHNSLAEREMDWDLIAGTFGFNPEGGGGNSAGFLLFQCYFITLCIARIRKKLATSFDYVVLFLAAVTIFFIEVKIVLALVFFIMISVLELSDIKKPRIIFTSFFVAFSFIFLIFYNYNANYSTGDREGRGMDEYVTNVYESYFIEEENGHFDSVEVSRGLAIKIWLAKQTEFWPKEAYIGYGLTSSKGSNEYIPESVMFGSPLYFASTQFTAYLWDTGVIGVLVLLLLLFSMLKDSAIGRRDSNVYVSIFSSGSMFIIYSMFLYPVYTLSMHANAISFTVMAFALSTCLSFRMNRAEKL
ncbi:hypothetical protein [Motilimonas cestriensis]|uniref:hypothetical protein n=1 Tax=Motilimonas cestriensis TaxID=2742685 RepID=UPI003DA55535